MATHPLALALPFIHPGLAVAALSTGLIPILVHLINRRRYRRVTWAAMPFLVAANRRSATRVRLEQWLLLLMRIALIVLLGLAVARPFLAASSAFPLGVSRSHRILVIDDSLSTNARLAGPPINTMSGAAPGGDAPPLADGTATMFDRERQWALALLDSFPETDSVSVITAAEPAHAIVAHAAYGRRVVRERVAGLAATQRRADIVGAMGLVADLLRNPESASDNNFVYVLSDFPKRTWMAAAEHGAEGAASAPTPAIRSARRVADLLKNPGVQLQFFSTGATAISNLAVTRLQATSPMVAVNFPIQITVEVTNHGSATASGLSLQLRRDDEIVRREPIQAIEPGNAAASQFSLEFSAPGTHLLEARLISPGGDDLRADDSRRLSLEVPESIAVLLVDGRPGTSPLAGQAGYLATALAPGPNDTSSTAFGAHVNWSALRPTAGPTLVAPKVLGESELPGEALFDYDVVVLCNVHLLTAEQWGRLERFVADAGGLMVFGGDLVNVDNYNRYGHAGGTGLLPAALQRPAPLPNAAGRQPGFQPTDLTHAIVREFAGHPDSGLFLARVNTYLPAEPDRDRSDVVLRYTNGAPALLALEKSKTSDGNGGETDRNERAAEKGGTTASPRRGRVLVFTTTANMDWNNLPGKGDFVSLMLNAVAYLAPGHGVHRNVEVGHLVHEPLTSVESSLPIRTIEEGNTARGGPRHSEGHVVPAGDTLAFEFGPVEQAGAIRVAVGTEVRGFAVNLAAGESDFSAISPAAFTAQLDRPFRFFTDASSAAAASMAAPSTELSSLALYGVLALLFIECLLGMQFGSRRAIEGNGSRVGAEKNRRVGAMDA